LQQQDEEEDDDDEAVAVKVLKAAAGPAAQDDLLQEAEIMVSFSHPNILSLKGIVINGKNKPSFIFAPNPTLNFHIRF
jgi:serine/threonine protein kinase